MTRASPLEDPLRLAGIPLSPELSRSWSALVQTRQAAERQLRAAATYPLSLSLGILLAGASVQGLAAPALLLLPSGRAAESGVLLVWGLALALCLLLGLGLVVGLRLPLPIIGLGWRSIEAWALLEGTRLLSEAGAELPRALRAAGQGCGGTARRQALALSRALEAGEPRVQADGPLFPIEVQTLVVAAQAGAAEPLLQALAEQRRVGLERTLPAAVDRVQYASLAIAGLAVLAIGATFFQVYSDALR